MSNIPAIPFVQFREFDATNLPLSGGSIWFYNLGDINTPRPTWSNVSGTVLNSNPVTLDASGSAKIFCRGAYSYIIKAADGSTITSGDFDSGLDASSGSGTVGIYANYAELQAATNHPSIAVVQGRLTAGDGGEGTFTQVPSGSPDGGIVLASGAYFYKRIFDGNLDPRWFGVAYDVSTDQSSALATALAASANDHAALEVTASIYVTQDVNVNDRQTVLATNRGAFIAPAAVKVYFNDGSKFVCQTKTVFRSNVSPRFSYGVVQEIRLSWMNANPADEDLLKWIGAPWGYGNDPALCLDANCITYLTDVTLNNALTIDSGILHFRKTFSLNIPKGIIYDGLVPFLYIETGIYGETVPTVNVNNQQVRPEWFGFNSSFPDSPTSQMGLRAAISSGNCLLSKEGQYTLAHSVTCSGAVAITGEAETASFSLGTSGYITSPSVQLKDMTFNFATIGQITGAVTFDNVAGGGGGYAQYSKTATFDARIDTGWSSSHHIDALTGENASITGVKTRELRSLMRTGFVKNYILDAGDNSIYINDAFEMVAIHYNAGTTSLNIYFNPPLAPSGDETGEFNGGKYVNTNVWLNGSQFQLTFLTILWAHQGGDSYVQIGSSGHPTAANFHVFSFWNYATKKIMSSYGQGN